MSNNVVESSTCWHHHLHDETIRERQLVARAAYQARGHEHRIPIHSVRPGTPSTFKFDMASGDAAGCACLCLVPGDDIDRRAMTESKPRQ